MTAVIAITSGNSKVGKSVLSANLAYYLNRQGYRTGLLIAGNDLPVWGVAPNNTWPNIIGGRISIDEAIYKDVFGVDLMVTREHGHALGNLSAQTAEQLSDPIGILDSYAYLIIDMAVGVNAPAIACCLAATETIMVINQEASSLTANFEWLAKLTHHGFDGPLNIILNKVRKSSLAQSVYVRFKELAREKLKKQTNLWGSMPAEAFSDTPALQQKPLSDVAPQSKLLKEIQIIGKRLLAEQPPENQTTPLRTFWQHFIQYIEKLPVMPYIPHIKAPDPTDESRTDDHDKQAPEGESLKTTQTDDYAPMIRKLSSQISAIHDELSVIRKLMEESLQQNGAVLPSGGGSDLNEMQIDFENFIARHQGKP